MNGKTKIITQKGKVITLKKLFEGKERTRRLMAGFAFEEKIKMLASLQEIAHSWGQKKDVLVWNISN
jgi:hypothetical protein